MKSKNPLICDPESGFWGIEPQLRKLKLAYGQNFEIEYKMGECYQIGVIKVVESVNQQM